MAPDQAMYNEANISRTLVADALAGRCAQLAGANAELENRIAALKEELRKYEKANPPTDPA